MSQLRNRKKFITKPNSRFSHIPTIVDWELFDLQAKYKEDTFPKKVNLVSAAFCLTNEMNWIMPLTKIVARAIATDDTLDKEYHRIEILGLQSFTFAATKLLLGSENAAIIEDKCFGVQTIGASGGICLGLRFLNKLLGYNTYYVSHPARQYHNVAFDQNGFTVSRAYRYFDELEHKINIKAMLSDLRNAPPNAVILLQMVGHNPTGCDLTEEQWKLVADVMEEKKLFPFFDCTYQGFGTGDLNIDAYAVRYFVQRGFEMFCVQSFSKNMTLYDESVGHLLVVLNSPKRVIQVRSQFMLLISCMYTNPAYYGARIVACILNNPQYLEDWKAYLKFIYNEIKERRNLLRQALERIQTPGIWEHITQQVGVFSYSGLNSEQCKAMLDDYHIYMLPSGRICLCGTTASNVEYIATSIHSVITKTRSKQSSISVN